ncbi:MAG: glycosyltransferase family 2 protein [Bacteroidales bacterium]
MAKVAVVILNYNGEKFLRKFLSGVVEFSSGVGEVVVADNASTDTSISYLKENFPSVRIVVNDDNGGYAKGYNDALKKIDADYFVLLNSDIEIKDRWLEPLIELMDNNPDVGACQPKLLSWHEPDKFEYAGGAGGFIDRYGYPFCRGRIFMKLEEDNGQYDQKGASEIFWATGACLMVRSEAFYEAGGFDDDFFAHMEEIDLCWRMKHLGYKIMYVPNSRVFHIGGGTLPKISARKTYLNFRNNSIVLIKNLPRWKLVKLIFIRLFLDGIAGLKFMMEGNFSHTLAVIRAHYYLYAHIGNLYKKRKRVKRSQKGVSCIYQGNIVFDHFLRKKNRFIQLNEDLFTK